MHVEFGLTPTEVVTLRLIAAGKSNTEIAHECFISPNTVKTRIRLAYKRIGVTSRSQAVLWAVEHGLGPDRSARTPTRMPTRMPTRTDARESTVSGAR